MDPILAGEVLKNVDVADIAKTGIKYQSRIYMFMGCILLIIIAVILIKKNRKKNKTESQQDAYIKSVSGDITLSNLSYSSAWYEAKAVTLANALDASFGNNGGILGCDQNTVYDVMKEMKTKDDVKKLEMAFGSRELNASWLRKKKPMLLREAIQNLMTTKEHKKVNEILAENGIDYSL